jgi:uroporphyrinogen III methyltransferase/synthase
MSVEETKGRVYLVGAGPGALDLVTLRARELIGQADVLVYDYLCNPEMLRWARAEAETIFAGKSGASRKCHNLTQEEINASLVALARAGKQVVRLKGGDPYVFGRGGEEAQALARARVPFEIVPGVTSAIAAPAYAGIPLTHRDFASTVTFVTGHEDPSKAESLIDWRHLARLRGTKIFLMGVKRLREIAQRLVAEGADPATPVALVRWGTTARQESLEGTLATVADLAEKRGFAAPAVTIVGEVVKLRRELNWFEALPLFGQRVVVTRTRRQASALTERLARLGADVLEIPTIRIVPVVLGETERNKLAAFSRHFDWMIFTSPNAVNLFFSEFFKLTDDLRALGAVKIAAVGPATAHKLNDLHLRADLQPEVFTAEKLAECFSAKDVASQRFLLPHGRLADPLLANHLREKGGLVEEWTLYDTEPEQEDPTGARARYLREGAHWITFTSSSTAENWRALQLQPASGAPQPKAVSLGPVTSATLRKLGYEIAAESPASTLDALIATICRLSIESGHAHD